MSEQEVFDALAYRIEVDAFGIRKYYNSAGLLHRLDGPAIECPDGAKFWVQNNLLHRTDGPAVVYANAEMQWWIHGEHMSEARFKQVVKRL